MLGQTVISSTIEYRRLILSEEEGRPTTDTSMTIDGNTEEVDSVVAVVATNSVRYYWVLFLALVIVFFYNLLYFAMSPPPSLHAFRRSNFLAVC